MHLASAYATRAARARLRDERRPTPDPALERELARLARSPTLLFRKKLVVLARKPTALAPAEPAPELATRR